MIYFDTDVLINYYFIQNPASHQLAVEKYKQAMIDSVFVTSHLAIIEFGFVSQRLGSLVEDIDAGIQAFLDTSPLDCTTVDIIKAIELAKLVGFQHINDCVHTAIAEHHGCTELYIFNKADFKRIQRHTKLKITML